MKDEEFEKEDLVNRVMERYEGVTREKAAEDIGKFLKLLAANNILDDGVGPRQCPGADAGGQTVTGGGFEPVCERNEGADPFYRAVRERAFADATSHIGNFRADLPAVILTVECAMSILSRRRCRDTEESSRPRSG